MVWMEVEWVKLVVCVKFVLCDNLWLWWWMVVWGDLFYMLMWNLWSVNQVG
jgi:hypothetical protein